mgnify:FL=1
MATLTFNKSHKNGWVSYRIAGLTGAVFIDGRMITPDAKATPPATLEVSGIDFLTPGAGASEKSAAAAAKKLAAEQAKAVKAAASAEKANARLAKLTAAAVKAQGIVDAARAKTEVVQ